MGEGFRIIPEFRILRLVFFETHLQNKANYYSFSVFSSLSKDSWTFMQRIVYSVLLYCSFYYLKFESSGFWTSIHEHHIASSDDSDEPEQSLLAHTKECHIKAYAHLIAAQRSLKVWFNAHALLIIKFMKIDVQSVRTPSLFLQYNYV